MLSRYPKFFILVIFIVILTGCAPLTANSSQDVNRQTLEEIVELFLNGENDEAHRRLAKFEPTVSGIVSDSDDGEIVFLIGRVYFYAEMDDKAADAFAAALRRDPSLSDAHYYSGVLYKFGGDFDAAEQSVRAAIQLNEQSAKYLLELGRILDASGDTGAALEAYLEALRISPHAFEANCAAANIFAEIGDFENAEQRYLAALASEPADIQCNYNLGQLYQLNARQRDALIYFRKVVEVDGTDWRAIQKVIQTSQSIGDLAVREQAIERIYEVWRDGARTELHERGFFIREQLSIDEGSVFGLEYFELTGERARKFVFKLRKPSTGEFLFDVSLGSYEQTTQFSRRMGEIGEDERLYHLDGYAPDGSHYTFAFFKELPDYDTVRKMALDAISGNKSAISATRPAGNDLGADQQ